MPRPTSLYEMCNELLDEIERACRNVILAGNMIDIDLQEEKCELDKVIAGYRQEIELLADNTYELVCPTCARPGASANGWGNALREKRPLPCVLCSVYNNLERWTWQNMKWMREHGYPT